MFLIHKNPFYIEVRASRVLFWYSKLTGTKGLAKAAAMYPFITLSDEIHPKMLPFFINHELIHFEQQKETLFIGFFLLGAMESIYAYLKYRKNSFERYLYISTEQEAYEHMFDLEYLKNRKHFAFKNYINNKSLMWEEYLKKKIQVEQEIV